MSTFLKAFVIVFTVAMWNVSAVNADLIFSDQFNTATLNPAWTVGYQNATSWDYSIGTNLTVSGIGAATQDTGSGGSWATISLGRSFTPVTDFNLGFALSWDSESSVNAMQYVGVELYGLSNNLIGTARYFDAWERTAGSIQTTMGGLSYFSGHSSLPLNGSAVIDITRTGTDIGVNFNGSNILIGINGEQLGGIKLVFGYYDYDGYAKSFFGSEAVDYLTLDGTLYSQPQLQRIPEPAPPTSPVPEPATILLLGAGLIGLAGYGRKKLN